MCKALDVAKYFISKSDPEIGDTLSNLKLQKLLYLAQGFNLAIYDKVLFPEHIEAWAHGPVVPTIYHEFKCYGSDAIPIQQFDLNLISHESKQLLDEIWEVFGQFSAWKLRDISHEHDPWKNTAQECIISPELMNHYFKQLIKANV